jgi:hypothetical protein
MLKRDEMAEPVVQEKALSAARQDFMVSGAQDERNITYTSILQQAKASGNATHASILSYIGYVPGNWDQVLAALAEDGIKLESQKNFPDPQRLHASGLSKVELRYILAMAGMPTVKIDAALKVFADTPAPAEKPQDPPRAGYAWTWDPVAAQYKETKVG